MGDVFAAVYEATAHRITGPVSNTALDILGVGPGNRIVDIAAGAGALSGPAAEGSCRAGNVACTKAERPKLTGNAAVDYG